MTRQKFESDEEPLHCLFEAISVLKNEEEAKMFFFDLCTPAELKAMAGRLQVVKLIKERKPYRQIYEETSVSPTTVGRVARYLAMGAGGYELMYERLKQRKDNERIKTKNSPAKKRAVK